MANSNHKFKILDCTIRDGGYLNNWNFDKKLVREVYRALSKSGVDIVELGYRGSNKYFDPKMYGTWRFTTEEDLKEVTNGIKGARIALMGDYGKIDLGDFEDQKNSAADMIRIAAHKNQIFKAIDQLEEIKEKGYETSLQAMGFTGYTSGERDEISRALKKSSIDYFYIADSYGSIFPHQIKELFDQFLELDNIRVGFHPHNSLQMAFANTLEAIRVGVDIVDGSIYGMGRGSGNLPIEALIAYLQKKSMDRYNVVPVLSCIDKYFLEMMRETPWGYQLPYMLSGMFECHPYYSEDLFRRREYTIEDIWRVMEVIEEIKPIGFDHSIIDNLIKKSIIGSLGKRAVLNETLNKEEKKGDNIPVPYIGRHIGRNFLVLANGPSLHEYEKQIKTFIKKYDPIVLGANYLGGLLIPQYHAFNNTKRFIKYIDYVNPKSKLLIGQNIPEKTILEYTSQNYETLFFKDILDTNFDIVNGVIQSNCRTISVLLLGVAIVMGADRIFVVGMDGYVRKNKNPELSLFYDEKDEPLDEDIIVERHKWNEKFLKEIDEYLSSRMKEGIHILTPTSYKLFYKGIENYL